MEMMDTPIPTEPWPVDQLVDARAAVEFEIVSSKESTLSRGDLSDKEWTLLEPMLPPERGREGRPAHDNRVVLNGILWRLRTGAPWREMPDRYGKWNSIYRRYSRWSQGGIWGPVAVMLSQMMIQGGDREPAASRRGRLGSRAAGSRLEEYGRANAPQAKRVMRRRGRS